MARADSETTTNIVQFAAFAAAAKLSKPETRKAMLARFRAEQDAKREAKIAQLVAMPEKLTPTCKNQRMRLARKDAWWKADRLTEWWRARLEWHRALSFAQAHGIGDSNLFPDFEQNSNIHDCLLVDLWRTALMNQVLTPAPDMAAVTWKRSQLRAEQYRYTHVTAEQIERAIAADVQWLKDRPTRAAKETGGAA